MGPGYHNEWRRVASSRHRAPIPSATRGLSATVARRCSCQCAATLFCSDRGSSPRASVANRPSDYYRYTSLSTCGPSTALSCCRGPSAGARLSPFPAATDSHSG